MAAERALLDTNVLVAATDDTRAHHLAARTLIESDPRALCVTPQVLREFLAVATRPVAHNGLGMSGARAVAALSEATSTVELIEETAGSRSLLAALVADDKAAGKQVHDANLIASAVVHEIRTVVTSNGRHFERFSDLIDIETLL